MPQAYYFCFILLSYVLPAFSCSAGYFQASGSVFCALCPLGYYCDGTNAYVCPAGTYGGSTALSTAACSGPCDAGFWGIAGQTSRRCSGVCDSGRWGSTGQTTTSCSGACAAGYWGGPAQVASTCAGQCLPGYWGATGEVSADCSGGCTAGFYCPAGSTSPTQVQCPAGYYCPSTTGAPLVCPPGYICLAGAGSLSPCTVGSYCPGLTALGAAIPCPSGTYGSVTALTQATCSGLCRCGGCRGGSTAGFSAQQQHHCYASPAPLPFAARGSIVVLDPRPPQAHP